MASSSIPVKEAEGERIILPNWLDLPRDITANILHRLGTFDVVTSACEVCSLWWNICKDPLMWRTISMTNFFEPLYHNYHLELAKVCCIAVERSCGHLESIDVEYFATDDLLHCIAQNGSNLQCLRLFGCPAISEKEFSDAVRKLSRLEKLDITYNVNIANESLEVLGQACPLLKSLKLANLNYEKVFCADDVPSVIAETMSGLYHLDIVGYNFTDHGLLAIIDGCPLLESHDIKGCDISGLSHSLKKRCFQQIKRFRL